MLLRWKSSDDAACGGFHLCQPRLHALHEPVDLSAMEEVLVTQHAAINFSAHVPSVVFWTRHNDPGLVASETQGKFKGLVGHALDKAQPVPG